MLYLLIRIAVTDYHPVFVALGRDLAGVAILIPLAARWCAHRRVGAMSEAGPRFVLVPGLVAVGVAGLNFAVQSAV